MNRFFVAVILLVLSSNAYSELYYEFALEGGGDPIVETNLGDVNAGAGIKLAVGIQNIVGENGENLSISLGSMFDEISADNGRAKFNTVTMDAIYSMQVEPHRFGIGASYHIGPAYRDNLFPSWRIDFEDALGLILQYSYKFSSGLQLGARLTNMEYKVSSSNIVVVGSTIDASSFGIFLSNGF